MDSSSTDETLVTAAGGQTRSNARALERGELLGRYVVLDKLGAGGMGVVYAAYDPDLDRKLAVKLIHPESRGSQGASTGRSRLLREAQVLAQLQHPNVVTVHDVGEHQGQVFIAMEFIEGMTLTEWLAQSERDWKETLAVMLRAGAGLGAAHSKGMVHRDFKPDNVMIANDGRVRVLDFGLARSSSDLTVETDSKSVPVSESESLPDVVSDSRPESLSGDLTAAGSLLGTPAYMSPEQHNGDEAGPRSDQFSFCVAAFEALHRQRPFAGDNPMKLALNVLGGKISEPKTNAKVPGRVRQAILRGLSPEPQNRWPSMQALLEELSRDPAGPRRRILLAGAVVALGGGLWGGLTLDENQRIKACELDAAEMDETWNEQSRAELRAALTVSGQPHAIITAEKTEARLDDYAKRWSEARSESCMQATVAGTRSLDLHSLTVECLDDGRDGVAALLNALTSAGDEAIRRAVPAVASLSRIGSCLDDRELSQRMPRPQSEQARTQVLEIERTLHEARALHSLRQYEKSLSLASDAAAAAAELAWEPLVAKAHYQLGTVLGAKGDYEEAARELQVAFLAATRSGDAELGAAIAGRLASDLASNLQREQEARTWLAIAEAALDSAGGEEDLARADWLMRAASVNTTAGDYAAASDEIARALAIRRDILGEDHPEVAQAMASFATAVAAAGDWKKSKVLLEEALAIRSRVFGPEHPDLPETLWTLARAHVRLEEWPEARASAQRAVDIIEASVPEKHPELGKALLNLSNTIKESDDRLPVIQRALGIMEEAMGPDHMWVANINNNLALLHLRAGRPAKSLPLFVRSLEIHEQTQGAEHPDVGLSLRNAARAYSGVGEHAKAEAHIRRSLALRKKVHGPEHPDVADALRILGTILMAAGRADEAVPYLEQALALAIKMEPNPVSMATARFSLAEALVASKRDRARALDLAREALATYEEREPENAKSVSKWIRRHGG